MMNNGDPNSMNVAPLEGIRVLDFSTLLPGPLASLILAEAGAEVIKVERPEVGEDMRAYPPSLDGMGGGFAMLNRGKKAVALDLRNPRAVESLLKLSSSVDIVVEQFRPGVMGRLGLDYEAFRSINPKIIYCSITGYGQTGPLAQVPGHDLNYQAETGLLSLCTGADGAPPLPQALIADIGAGTYPTVVNILLALRRRDRTGEGCFIDIAMAENLFTFMFWGLAMGHGTGRWPQPGKELLTGGSPRYQVYPTKDGRYVAVAALEDKFWQAFCEIAEIPKHLCDDMADPDATAKAVRMAIVGRPASYWERALGMRDTCCSVVRTLQEAVQTAHFAVRDVFSRQVSLPGHVLPALPVPVIPALRVAADNVQAPVVGRDNAML